MRDQSLGLILRRISVLSAKRKDTEKLIVRSSRTRSRSRKQTSHRWRVHMWMVQILTHQLFHLLSLLLQFAS